MYTRFFFFAIVGVNFNQFNASLLNKRIIFFHKKIELNNETKQSKAKQNKTKQNKTKQNKTKQNKTKQNKNLGKTLVMTDSFERIF